MTLKVYEETAFRRPTMLLIGDANTIIDEFEDKGFLLTLRQLYYQLVARGILENKQTEYKRLGSVVAKARMSGLISWRAIEDRTRQLKKNTHWHSPQQIIQAAIKTYQEDKWKTQPYRLEVWIEKDALVGVIAGVCKRLDVPYFSCRGYTSLSEMWKAGYDRIKGDRVLRDQATVILHLGDHDPSGIDMTRDIADRLETFSEEEIVVERLALNMPQIEHFNPPPNPTKLTDSRASMYIRLYGNSSWELDALSPDVLSSLIERAVLGYRDEALWKEAVENEEEGRDFLKSTIG